MPKLPRVQASEVIRALERIGFVRVRQRGSHVMKEKTTLIYPNRRGMARHALTCSSRSRWGEALRLAIAEVANAVVSFLTPAKEALEWVGGNLP